MKLPAGVAPRIAYGREGGGPSGEKEYTDCAPLNERVSWHNRRGEPARSTRRCFSARAKLFRTRGIFDPLAADGKRASSISRGRAEYKCALRANAKYFSPEMSVARENSTRRSYRRRNRHAGDWLFTATAETAGKRRKRKKICFRDFSQCVLLALPANTCRAQRDIANIVAHSSAVQVSRV